jgi:predicted nucleic acid-binding protein
MNALVDSNVLIAATDSDHEHNGASLRFLALSETARLATSSHCLNEAYSTLTRGRQSGGSAFTPRQAIAALDRIADALDVVALTMTDERFAVRSFADMGGTGPRLYDYLIGYAAIVNSIPAIVTWNIKHFVPLFPNVAISSPAHYLESL